MQMQCLYYSLDQELINMYHVKKKSSYFPVGTTIKISN